MSVQQFDYTAHVVNLMQAKHLDSGAVVQAPDYGYYPASLVGVDLPIAVTYPDRGRGTTKTQAVDFRRRYITEVFVAPAARVTTREFRGLVGETIDKLIAYWTGLNDLNESYILDYGATSGVAVQVDWTQPIEESGPITSIDYLESGDPDDFFHGFQLSIPMQVMWGDRIC